MKFFCTSPRIRRSSPAYTNRTSKGRLNFNCGMSSLPRTIGPAIRCGQNITNRARSMKLDELPRPYRVSSR
jgi:hypothetical protein